MRMAKAPLVSVIVVNWNGIGTIQKCLDSLFNQTYPSIEIIVVDNHSEDGSYEKGVSLYGDKVKWIRNLKNEGFARGNNLGIQISKGEHILLLNNDAWADKDWVHHLLITASLDRQIGMVASRIYLVDEIHTIDNTGHVIYPDGLSWGRGRLQKDIGQFNLEDEVIFPSGCAALYKKEMLNEIGLFDERFFAYCEDTDLGLRGRLYGWRCFYSPKAIVYHYFSKSTSGVSTFKAFLVERNRRWVLIKNFPFPYLFLTPWYTFKRHFWQIYGMLKGRGMTRDFVRQNSILSGMLIMFKAWWEAWREVPSFYRDRHKILKEKRISQKEFGRLLRNYSVSAKTVGMGEKEVE